MSILIILMILSNFIIVYIYFLAVKDRVYNNRLFLFLILSGLICMICISSLFLRFFIYSNNSIQYKIPKTLYDRNGLVIAYTSKKGQLYINPNMVTDVNMVYDYIKQYKNITIDEFNNIMKNNKYMKVIDELPMDFINIKHINGLEIQYKQVRKYPLGKMVTSIGYNNMNHGITTGLERLIVEKEQDIYSTIDTRSQIILAQQIEESELYNNDENNLVFGLIMNLNGEIEAIHYTSCPDPNIDKPKIPVHPIFGCTYELGSVCKLFTLWSGINENIIDADSLIPNKQITYIEGRAVYNHIQFDKPLVTPYEMMGLSLNGPIIYIGKALGDTALRNLRNFGVLDSININGICTPRGSIPKNPTKGDMATMCFGYAISINIVSFCRAICGIFNQGIINNPTMIMNHKTNIYNKINSKTCRKTKEIMLKCVQSKVFAELSAAAKTGTVYCRFNNQYIKDRYNIFVWATITNNDDEIIKIIFIGALRTNKLSIHVSNLAADIAKRLNISFF